jgi:hypothetical protein
MVTLTATATDNIGIRKVIFRIGAQQLCITDFTAPYTCLWDSSEIANGARTLTVDAYDMNLNLTSATRSVTVSN